MDFFEILKNKLIPAVDQGDREKDYEIVYGSLREKYEEHRKVIDQVVKETTSENQRIEAKAKESITTRTGIMLALALGVPLATIIYSALFTRSIYQALSKMYPMPSVAPPSRSQMPRRGFQPQANHSRRVLTNKRLLSRKQIPQSRKCHP